MPKINLALIAIPLLFALGTANATMARTAGEPAADWEMLEQRPGTGEQCIVCGKQVYGDDIVELRYRGRVFHVGAGLLGDFRGDPDRYFAKLQSRSALFDEESMNAHPLASGWLWFGTYVLVGLVFGAACGYLAIGRARPPLLWFLAGLLVNVVALAALLFSPKGDASALPAGIPKGLRKVPTTRSPINCASCGASNHPSATACAGCHAPLEPTVASEADRAIRHA